jgi:hypothetical protein
MALSYPGRRTKARAILAAGAATETEVLPKGEIGFVSDTGELRVGDGATAFSALKSSRNHRKLRTVTITGNVNIDDEVLIVNAAGATTQTFPAAAAGNAGRIITVSNKGAGTATIAGTAGVASLAGAGTSARYVSDGSAWLAA